MRGRRPSLVFGLGRDLLLAAAAFWVSLLIVLSLQSFSTGQALRERSLDEAAQYVARNLQIGPDGQTLTLTQKREDGQEGAKMTFGRQ